MNTTTSPRPCGAQSLHGDQREDCELLAAGLSALQPHTLGWPRRDRVDEGTFRSTPSVSSHDRNSVGSKWEVVLMIEVYPLRPKQCYVDELSSPCLSTRVTTCIWAVKDPIFDQHLME